MPIQLATVAALAIGAFLAVPHLYENRFDPKLFWVGIAVFCILPPLAGMFQGQPRPPLTLFAAAMLLACPLVYLITDSMDARFEVGRDCFFLATFAIVSLISGAWTRSLVRAGRWSLASGAAICSAAASFGAFVLIALVLYME
jgi:hypothetical protein